MCICVYILFSVFLQEKLAESMTELALLGSLLGLPSIFDPMFPATYASFFGSYPPWMEEGAGSVGVKKEDQKVEESSTVLIPASPNVCLFVCIYKYTVCVVCNTYIHTASRRVC